MKQKREITNEFLHETLLQMISMISDDNEFNSRMEFYERHKAQKLLEDTGDYIVLDKYEVAHLLSESNKSKRVSDSKLAQIILQLTDFNLTEAAQYFKDSTKK